MKPCTSTYVCAQTTTHKLHILCPKNAKSQNTGSNIITQLQNEYFLYNLYGS